MGELRGHLPAQNPVTTPLAAGCHTHSTVHSADPACGHCWAWTGVWSQKLEESPVSPPSPSLLPFLGVLCVSGGALLKEDPFVPEWS